MRAMKSWGRWLLPAAILGVLLLAAAAFGQDNPAAYDQGRKLGEQVGRTAAGPCCSLMLIAMLVALLMNGGAGFWLSVGIVFFPYIFSWFTLREGIGILARVVAFGWMVFSLCILGVTITGAIAGFAAMQKLHTAQNTEDTTPPDLPAPTVVEVPVTSDPPGATVIVDGKAVDGVTPTSISIMTARETTVELRKAGYLRATRTVTALTDDVPKVDVKLQQAAILKVTTTPPGARVLMGGEIVGATPTQLDVEGGQRTVELRLDGYLDVSRDVVAKAGEQTPVEVELEKGVLLHVTSTPDGADVTLDGNPVQGKTPLNLTVAPKSSHTLRVEQPPATAVTRTVKAGAPGTTQQLAFSLTDQTLAHLKRAVANAEARSNAANQRLDDAQAESDRLDRRTPAQDLKMRRKLKGLQDAADAAQAELDDAEQKLDEYLSAHP